MKKILMTINNGSTARNFLKNDFYLELRENFEIYILTPADKAERFTSEFAHKNVKFINFQEDNSATPIEKIFHGVYKMLIFNPSVDIRMRYGMMGTAYDGLIPYPVYVIKKNISQVLSKFKFLLNLVRFLDYEFLQKESVKKFSALVKEIDPDLVFLTSIVGNMEVAIGKAARKLNKKVWTMPKSWDNPSKFAFRFKSDKVVVWSPFVKEQMMKYQNYKANEIEMVGILQHDYLHDPKRVWPYEKFCQEMGLDPERITILFGSEGKQVHSDSEVAEILAELINSDSWKGRKLQMLVRPHTGYINEVEKFKSLKNIPHVVVDEYCQHDLVFKDGWDYSDYFMDRFLNTFYHSSIIVNTASTLTLDALVFDKPVVNIYFDGRNPVPFDRSTIRWYKNDYYQSILKFNATLLAPDIDALKNAINSYLDNPGLLHDERMKLREEFNYLQDGKAGKRLFELINNQLK